MIALYLFPLYLVINAYVVHRLYGFLEGCNRRFKFRTIKMAIAILYAVPAFSPLIGFFMPYGNVLKGISQRLCNYWFAVIVYTVIVVAVGHLISLLLRRVFKVLPNDYFQKRGRKLFYGIVTILIIFGITSYGIYNAHNIKVNNYSVTINKTVEGMRSMKVVLIADLHMGYSIGVKHIQKMVDLVNQQNPDLVCIAGETTMSMRKFLPALPLMCMTKRNTTEE